MVACTLPLIGVMGAMLLAAMAYRGHMYAAQAARGPFVTATVLSTRQERNGVRGMIAFVAPIKGLLTRCQAEVYIARGLDGSPRIGSAVRIVPREDSCGEPAVVQPSK